VKLKSRSEWQLIGKLVPRVDIPEKVNGSAIYPMDMELPGMLVGVPVIGYTWGSTIRWYDDSTTLKVPGVKKVVKVGLREWLPRGVAGRGGGLLRRDPRSAGTARRLERLSQESTE